MIESENLKNVAVSEIMTRNVKTVKENESVRDACKLMYQENVGSIVVLRKDTGIDETDPLATSINNMLPMGIVTERDIARIAGFSNKSFADMPVLEIMSQPLITINPAATIKDAAYLMDQKDIRRLPVVDTKGQMIGIITAKDIFKPLMKIFKQVAKDKDIISDGFDLLGLIGIE